MLRYILASLLALSAGPVLADGVCYGTLDGICKAPALSVQPAATIALPGDIYADTAQSPVTLSVAVVGGTISAPTMIGSASVLSASGSGFAVSGAGPFAVTGLSVSGDFLPGDSVIAHVTLANPNTGAVLFDGDIALAEIAGITDAVVPTFNPGGNLTQQSFLRVTNPGQVDARVILRPTDDAGVTHGDVIVIVPAGASLQLTADELEAGSARLHGAFGHGSGKWRVRLIADQPVTAQALVRSNGVLTNVSGLVK